MAISENTLLVSYDEQRKVVVIFRLTEETVSQLTKILHTEISLSKVDAIDFKELSCRLGEDTLIALSGTRALFLTSSEDSD